MNHTTKDNFNRIKIYRDSYKIILGKSYSVINSEECVNHYTFPMLLLID